MTVVLHPDTGVVRGLLRTARPRQWVKNVLVLTAPVAAGVIADVDVLRAAVVAFVTFCIAASGIYLVNDARDVEEDRAHPVKSLRPIASGAVPVRAAWTGGVLLLVLAPLVALLATPELCLVIAVYEAVQLAYCFGLKHEPVLELVIVASGFLLRAVAGGAANGIPLSQWFLATAGFGSLFMAAGKRYAEARLVERTGARLRPALDGYTSTYLRFVWTLSAGVALTTYSLWAFELQRSTSSSWGVVSVVPFVIGVLRYAIDVDSGHAGEPEEIVLHDRVLLTVGAVWLLTLLLAVYT